MLWRGQRLTRAARSRCGDFFDSDNTSMNVARNSTNGRDICSGILKQLAREKEILQSMTPVGFIGKHSISYMITNVTQVADDA